MSNKSKEAFAHIEEDCSDRCPCVWQLESFYACYMKDYTNDPTHQDVVKANKTKEQLHIDSRFRMDSYFEEGSVKRIEHGRHQCQGVAQNGVCSMAILPTKERLLLQ